METDDFLGYNYFNSDGKVKQDTPRFGKEKIKQKKDEQARHAKDVALLVGKNDIGQLQ